MVGPQKREASGIILNYFYSVGEALVGVLFWLYPHWITLQLLVSVPPLLFIGYYWIVPESVRWLLARKHYTKARKIIRKAAHVNGVVLSEHILQSFELKSSEDGENVMNILLLCKQRKAKHIYYALCMCWFVLNFVCKTLSMFVGQQEAEKEKEIEEIDEAQKRHDVWRTFKEVSSSKILMFRALILFFIWATNAFVFYGLSLNSTSLSGNKYVNFILVCLVEIPGYTLSWFTMNKIGRRWSLAGSLLLCSFTCFAGGFVPQGIT